MIVEKRCGCGASYSRSEWNALPFVGLQADGLGGSLELRNCTACSSTIAVGAVSETDDTVVIAADLARKVRRATLTEERLDRYGAEEVKRAFTRKSTPPPGRITARMSTAFRDELVAVSEVAGARGGAHG